MRRASRTLLVVAVALVVSAVAAAVSIGAARPAVLAASQDSANIRAARADARSLLALLRLPHGATPSAREPAGDAGALTRTSGLYDLPSQVDEHAFWTVAASPQRVLAFVKAFPPDSLKPFETGFGSDPGRPNTYDEAFQWPPITNVLETRELWVEATVLADGMTGVRADAEVLAITPRGNLERIPAATARLSVTTDAAGGGRILLASVTSQAKIRNVAALLNGLPLLPLPVSPGCPPTAPQPVQLAFYTRRDAPLAVATFLPWTGPCSLVSLTINGRQQHALLARWYPASGLSRFPPLLVGLDATLNIEIPNSVPSG